MSQQPPKQAPSLLNRAKHLAGAAGRIGKAAASGDAVKVDNDTRNKRITICESNECGAFNKKERLCNWCGCFINQKAKFATEICGEREIAEQEGTAGYDWWEAQAVNSKGKVEAPKAQEPAPQRTKRFATAGNTHYITGAKLLEQESDLRMVLPTNGELVKKFNEYHVAQSQPGGCSGCRKNSFGRAFETALSTDFVKQGTELVEKVKAVYPESLYISAPSPITWDELMKRIK
jgi:hypothetical protein